MKFGFVLPNNWGLPDPGPVIDLAVEAEELGLDSVWVNHHVINIGYIADRLDDRPYYDALAILTWAAARTKTITLGTSVLVLPYLHPMVLARSLATIDQLSNGRLIAGVGVGSLPEENEALGGARHLSIDYASRGRWSDEFIEVMQALWSPGPANYAGDHFTLDDIVAAPKPAQEALALWIGGSGAPARRRAARFGHGWHPLTSIGGLGKRMPAMREAMIEAGRSDDDLIVAPRIDVSQIPNLDAVEAWADAGADQLIVGTSSSDVTEIRAGLAHIASLAAAS